MLSVDGAVDVVTVHEVSTVEPPLEAAPVLVDVPAEEGVVVELVVLGGVEDVVADVVEVVEDEGELDLVRE